MPINLMKKFGGLYPDGFHVLMYDRSVRWVDPKIVTDQELWTALSPDEGCPKTAWNR
jgi:hypothetical protein